MIKEGNKVKRYLVEIKPYNQTKPPKTKYRKKQHLLYEQKQWAVNTSKWARAEKLAKKQGREFILITEKDLK
jgi:hypothetical protein